MLHLRIAEASGANLQQEESCLEGPLLALPNCREQSQSSRRYFSLGATMVLRDWFFKNYKVNKYPFASPPEKLALKRATGLTTNQIGHWLRNARRRVLPQLIEKENRHRSLSNLPPLEKAEMSYNVSRKWTGPVRLPSYHLVQGLVTQVDDLRSLLAFPPIEMRPQKPHHTCAQVARQQDEQDHPSPAQLAQKDVDMSKSKACHRLSVIKNVHTDLPSVMVQRGAPPPAQLQVSTYAVHPEKYELSGDISHLAMAKSRPAAWMGGHGWSSSTDISDSVDVPIVGLY